jgi:non-specific serine/threonine protein kinase
LFELGASEVGTALPVDVSYCATSRAVGTAICTHPDLAADHTIIPAPALDELEALVAAAPPMIGAEYLTPSVLEALWTETATAFRSELAESKCRSRRFFTRRNAAWHLVGRVHFNLAENRRDDEAPFAVSGDLYDATIENRQGAASAARPRAERIRRCCQQAAVALIAPPGPARRGPSARG